MKPAFYSDSSNWVDDVLYINEYLIEAKFAIPNPYSVKPGTTLIVRKAFEKCTGLTRLHIPSSVTIIGSDLLPENSDCIICLTTAVAYAKTYAQGNGFTFEVCSGHEYVSIVHVTGVTLDIASKTLAVNSTQQLTTTVVPTNSTYKDVTWKSSNTAVADMPEGAKIEWRVQGSGVTLKVSADGTTCDVTSIASGMVTVTAKIVDEDGEPITDADDNEIAASQQIKSNAGFFQKLISFFKNLFRISRIIVQSIDR